MTKIISDEDYDTRFKAFLESVGPNTGSGFWGKQSWQQAQRDAFEAQLVREGYFIDTTEADAASRQYDEDMGIVDGVDVEWLKSQGRQGEPK